MQSPLQNPIHEQSTPEQQGDMDIDRPTETVQPIEVNEISKVTTLVRQSDVLSERDIQTRARSK